MSNAFIRLHRPVYLRATVTWLKEVGRPMVRIALITLSKPHSAVNKLQSSPKIYPPTLCFLSGAKSILCCSLERARASKSKLIKMQLGDRLTKKDGVTHASAPLNTISHFNA